VCCPRSLPLRLSTRVKKSSQNQELYGGSDFLAEEALSVRLSTQSMRRASTDETEADHVSPSANFAQH
jgi:hypothetical protein